LGYPLSLRCFQLASGALRGGLKAIEKPEPKLDDLASHIASMLDIPLPHSDSEAED